MAAVRALGSCRWRANDAQLHADRLQLIKDPDVDLRKAAALSLGGIDDLADAFKAEKDPFVRLVLLGAQQPVRRAAIEAAFRDGTVFVAFLMASSVIVVEEAKVTAVAREKSGKQRRFTSSHSKPGDLRYSTGRTFAFDPPLAPGTYRFWVEGHFRVKGGPSDLEAKSRVSEITVPAKRAAAPKG